MKNKLLPFILTTCLFSCCFTPQENKQAHECRPTAFCLAPTLASITDSFLTRYPHWKYYDLFINRITEDSTLIVLAASNDYLSTHVYQARFQPLVTVRLKQKTINVYSGIESYIVCKNTPDKPENRPLCLTSPYDFANWAVFCSPDTIRVDTLFINDFPVEAFSNDQFTHKRTVRFTAPTIRKTN